MYMICMVILTAGLLGWPSLSTNIPGESNWQSTGQIAASQGFVSLRIELQSWQNC